MKSFLICVFAAFTFISCSKDNGHGVQVRFINATGKDITDISVDNLPIGDIAAGTTTDYYSFKQFGTDTGIPDTDFIGTVDKTRVKSISNFFWCGTEKSKLQQGEYTVRVTLTTSGQAPYFYMAFE